MELEDRIEHLKNGQSNTEDKLADHIKKMDDEIKLIKARASSLEILLVGVLNELVLKNAKLSDPQTEAIMTKYDELSNMIGEDIREQLREEAEGLLRDALS